MLHNLQCYRVIFAYMGFAVANIFFLITGLLLILLCQRGGVHVDAFSLVYMLFNFSVSCSRAGGGMIAGLHMVAVGRGACSVPYLASCGVLQS